MKQETFRIIMKYGWRMILFHISRVARKIAVTPVHQCNYDILACKHRYIIVTKCSKIVLIKSRWYAARISIVIIHVLLLKKKSTCFQHHYNHFNRLCILSLRLDGVIYYQNEDNSVVFPFSFVNLLESSSSSLSSFPVLS